MKRREPLFTIFILIFLHPGHSEFISENPCDFWDSVDISSGIKQENGSYVHDGVLYLPQHMGLYDHKYINSTHMVPTVPHLRGCICKIKSCVRMCCEHFQALDEFGVCVGPTSNISTTVKGEYKDVDVRSDFGLVYGERCISSYVLEPLTYEGDKWILLEDGSILLVQGEKLMTRDEYCLLPTLEGNETIMRLNPLVCATPPDNSKFIFYGIAVCISVPFMVITLIVYATLFKLRNLHGKSLCCYLFALSLGYSCLGYLLLTGHVMNGTLCIFLGCVAYYSFIAAFCWLNIISFDVWWNFRAVASRGRTNERRRFIFYSVYSWGLAMIFLIIVLIVQNSNLPEDMKPGIGSEKYCFLNVYTWMQLIYFYGHILAVITFNTTVFVLTIWKIYRVNKEITAMVGQGESRSSYNREKANIFLFLRLFIIMGVTWSLEILSWLCGQKYRFIFYASDLCNAIQGLIIFIVFLCRERVRKLLLQKYYRFRGMQREESCKRTSGSSDASASKRTTRSDNSEKRGRPIRMSAMGEMTD